MIIDLICFIAGVVIGMAIKQERALSEYNKTYDQLDEQLRKDLAYYRNLSDSLKQDVKHLRFKLAEKNGKD
jgi:hypothetical protein